MEERNTEKSKYYYLCSYPLREGSIVEKGNWGRILRKYHNFHFLEELLLNNRISGDAIITGDQRTRTVIIDQKVIRELIFERIRRIEFSKVPSRLDCLFVCKTIEGAKSFKGEGRNLDLTYEVEAIDANSRVLETDWSWINEQIIDLLRYKIL